MCQKISEERQEKWESSWGWKVGMWGKELGKVLVKVRRVQGTTAMLQDELWQVYIDAIM